MARRGKRRFGRVRKLPSGRFQARYRGPDGADRPAPDTFATRTDADIWLSQVEADLTRGEWRDPDAGAVNFETYARAWVREGGLRPTTAELYERNLRLHVLPTFRARDLDEITPARVRAWWAALAAADVGSSTRAKSYRLLRSILETAVEDELIRRNPCRIKGAGVERAAERPVATVAEVFALAEAVGPRWRLMVLLGAFATLRPEELAELRRKDVDPAAGTLRVRMAAPELTTGRRVEGDTKSDAGRRTLIVPEFMRLDLRRHVEWFAEDGPEGLLFVGERQAPFRRSTFGRRFRRARETVGLPAEFRFYDLRHTGNSLAADTGAKLKDLMVRMGQSSVRAAMIYQHSSVEKQRDLAAGLDRLVRAELAGSDGSNDHGSAGGEPGPTGTPRARGR